MIYQERCPYTINPTPCPGDCAKCAVYMNVTTRLMPLVRAVTSACEKGEQK